MKFKDEFEETKGNGLFITIGSVVLVLGGAVLILWIALQVLQAIVSIF